jgi:hypothetical protein
MRFLNGFVLIGIILLFISIGGVASGNRLLTEPGQAPNKFAWLEYMGAAAIMLINGAISIHLAAKNRPAEPAPKSKEQTPDESDAPSVEPAQ